MAKSLSFSILAEGHERLKTDNEEISIFFLKFFFNFPMQFLNIVHFNVNINYTILIPCSHLSILLCELSINMIRFFIYLYIKKLKELVVDHLFVNGFFRLWLCIKAGTQIQI